jgi:hypothetical protein
MYTSPDNTDPATSAEPSADRVDDLEQLRERLAFYESFDQLINDNITRAGDLLREAAARKSEGELALRQTTAEFEQRQLAERGNYRRIFSSLLDEITAVQQNVERLARQVSDALDDLEAVTQPPANRVKSTVISSHRCRRLAPGRLARLIRAKTSPFLTRAMPRLIPTAGRRSLLSQ